MSKVTISSVRQRLAWLEDLNARGVGTAVAQQQFELACLRMLLAGMEQEPVTIPKHITKVGEATLDNILANDDESPMANAARLLVREVRFWRQQPLYAAPQPLTDAERAELESVKAQLKAAQAHITELEAAPIVPTFDELRVAFESVERESYDGFNLHKYGIGYADETTQARWEQWVACRAAMLNGGKS